jgi:hypothetical protein
LVCAAAAIVRPRVAVAATVKSTWARIG